MNLPECRFVCISTRDLQSCMTMLYSHLKGEMTMPKTTKPTPPKTGYLRDILAILGIGFAWVALLVLLMFLLYTLQGMMNIGYEYVMETDVNGEEMWRVIPPSLDFAMTLSMLLVLVLLYWRLKRKKQMHPGAFSLRRIRPYSKAIVLVILCYAGCGLVYAMSGDLDLTIGEGIIGVLRNAEIMVLLALFSMLLLDGRIIGYLRGKGRSDEEIVRVIAQETLLLDILAGLLGTGAAYLRGEAVGIVGVEDIIALLAGVAYAVLFARLYLASGSMMGRGVLMSAAWLVAADASSYAIWHYAADALLLLGLCAAIRMVKEKRADAKTA